MFSTHDEKNGLVKITWVYIRDRIKKLDQKLVTIIDELNPDATFPLFLAYYNYGDIISDTISPYIPLKNASLTRLSDSNVDKVISKHLGYGQNSLPMSMVLEKEIEYFIDLPNEGLTIPWLVYKPGRIFPYSTIFGFENEIPYTPNGILSVTSGARSVFMLPNIGCATQHINLQREYNIKQRAPKNLTDHWHIFKKITQKNNNAWKSCILYFSEKWVKKLQEDNAWSVLKNYLLEKAWTNYEFERNRIYYDIAFSVMLKKRNLKPNPFLTDTAKHLFTITLGANLGFTPASTEDALPISILQTAYQNIYGLKKYFPTLMQPKNFNIMSDTIPVYYSLQHPTLLSFSPKSRKISSALHELRELEHLIKIFIEELSNENSLCSTTILSQMAKIVKFNYFHNEHDSHQIIKHSAEIINFDDQFKASHHTHPVSLDAKFLRGCIAIYKK